MNNELEHQHGFTLVEIQIAILILLLIFALVSGVLHFTAKSTKVSDKFAAEQSQRFAISQLLRQQINSIVPLQMTDTEPSQILFEGEASSVYYVSYLPEYLVMGGPWLIRLSINDVHQLLFGYVAINHQLSWQANMHAEFTEIVLLDEVEQFEIQYLSKTDSTTEEKWQSNWFNKTILPALIKVNVIQDGHVWPELIEPIYSFSSTKLPMHALPNIPHD